ncbi:MAG: energy transducer TonB [Prolixibacteraceae bacterium]
MKFLLFVFMFSFVFFAAAQPEAVYYFGVNGKVETTNSEHTKIVVHPDRSNKFDVFCYSYANDGWKKIYRQSWKELNENEYIIRSRKGKKPTTLVRNYIELEDGKWQFIETNHQHLLRRGICTQKIPLILEGTVTEYYENGTVRSESIYRNNELISNKNWLENGVTYYNDLFYSVDRYPAFSRGNDQLNKCIFQYLKDQQVDFSKITGQMVLAFVVFENGEIGGFRVLKGISPYMEQLVVDAFREINGDWIPARLKGQNVRFLQVYPISFTHDEFQLEFFDFSSGLAQFERK